MNDVTTRTQSTAVGALQSLRSGLQNVQQQIVTVGGDPFLRLLKDGGWVYGAENIEVEEGSIWAVNPLSLAHGFVSWSDNKKGANEILGEVMVPATSPLPNRMQLQDTGQDWKQQLAFQIACTSGEDKGQQTLYKTTAVGGMNAVKALIAEIMKQLDKDPNKPVPLIELSADSYVHKTYGKTYVPEFVIKGWAPLDGDQFAEEEAVAQAAAAPSKAEEQPAGRRRGSVPSTSATSSQQAEEAPSQDEPAAAAASEAGEGETLRRRRRR